MNMLSTCKVVPTVVPVLANNTAEGTGEAVDTRGFSGITMIANQGISGDTLATGTLLWTITFQECAVTTAGSFTLIAAADLQGGGATVLIDAAAEDPTTIVRHYIGKLRYVRILWTQTGTHTNGTPICGVVVLSDPIQIPQTQTTELGTPS
jgi:hypothetical protein